MEFSMLNTASVDIALIRPFDSCIAKRARFLEPNLAVIVDAREYEAPRNADGFGGHRL